MICVVVRLEFCKCKFSIFILHGVRLGCYAREFINSRQEVSMHNFVKTKWKVLYSIGIWPKPTNGLHFAWGEKIYFRPVINHSFYLSELCKWNIPVECNCWWSFFSWLFLHRRSGRIRLEKLSSSMFNYLIRLNCEEYRLCLVSTNPGGVLEKLVEVFLSKRMYSSCNFFVFFERRISSYDLQNFPLHITNESLPHLTPFNEM